MIAGQENTRFAILGDRESSMQAAAERVVGAAATAIASHRRFTWVLSGGSTPRGLYTALASSLFAGRIDWRHVHFFWGDERCVPPGHAGMEALPAQLIRPTCGALHWLVDAEAAARLEPAS